jgi:competence protein ComEA
VRLLIDFIKNNKIISVIFIIFLLSAVGYTILYINEQKNKIIDEINFEQDVIADESKEIENKIFIDIAGQVVNPGLYELIEGARTKDAIDMAGGLTDKACLDEINLAYKLSDGIKITIPQKEVKETPKKQNVSNKVIQTEISLAPSTSSSNLININTATSDELDKLSGIGSATAKKIIEYREKNGGFKTKEDIMKVSGIGESKFQKIKDNIIV